MTWGKSVKMLQDIARSSGETPKALRDRPLIGEADYFYVSSFYELNAFRPVGTSLQPLTVSDIKAYMEILGDFSSPQKYRFLNMMKELDQAYISLKVEKSDEKP